MHSVVGTITIDVDPVLHLGGLAIHWYGVMYVVAFLAGYRFGVRPHLVARGIPPETAERLTGWVILFGLLGARLYYVVQSSPPQGGSWFQHPLEILAVWHGGMAFFGAILGGMAAVGVLAWRQGYDFWALADAAVLFAVIGQPIGRIGNIINGDILGPPSSLPWATAYAHPDAVLQPHFTNCHAFIQQHIACVDQDTGQPAFYHPAAAYEALGTILIGAVLLALLRRGSRTGLLALAYAVLYPVSQLVIFHWRASEPAVALGLRQAQWTAIVMLAVVVPLAVLAWRSGRLDFSGGGPERKATRAGTPPRVEPGVGTAAPATGSASAASSGQREAGEPPRPDAAAARRTGADDAAATAAGNEATGAGPEAQDEADGPAGGGADPVPITRR